MIFCPVITLLATITTKLASTSLVLKVSQDLIVDNSIYVQHIATIRLNKMTMCVHRCDQISEGRSNLRKYTIDKQTCECYHATSDFRDSRKVAPKTSGSVMFVNLSPCEFQITSEHAVRISTIQKTGITKNECLAQTEQMEFPVYTATFCPDEELCGISLRPENTTQLKLQFKKTCLMFVKNVHSCRAFETQLANFDFDECQIESCGNGTGRCQNIINQGYDCSCFSGFERRYNWNEGKSFCQDFDECRKLNTCPGSFARCQNEIGSFRCVCQEGFEQETPTSVCTDINECNMGIEMCPGPHDSCVNTVGSFLCPCETSGFYRISETSNCSDVNECASNTDACPGPFDVCENSLGSFSCPCVSSGFERVTVDSDCSDIDECDTDTNCPDPDSVCLNTIGNFSCPCESGFERVHTNANCTDIDECDLPYDACPGSFDECQNNPGTFTCPCISSGFARLDLNSDCSDIDECLNPVDPVCPGPYDVCNNTPGNYTCECLSSGFERLSENSQCTDIDECDLTGFCPGPNDFCKNNPGSYSCPCESTGFQRVSENSDCLDVDECVSALNSCPGPNDTCTNTHGSFECPCEEGFERLSEETDCVDVNECLQDVCSGVHETCSNNEGSFACVCSDGFKRVSTAESDCVDIDECSVSAHDCISAAYCINREGSFACAKKIYVTGGTSSEVWGAGYLLTFGYTVEGAVETPTKCFYTRNRNSEYAHLDIPLSDVTQIKLLNYPSGYAHHMEHTFVEVCEKDVSCKQCGDPAPATGGQQWAVFDCQGTLRGNQIKIMRIGDILTFCEIDISGATVVI